MINFTDSNFKFISRPHQYFIEGSQVQLELDCSKWNPKMIIEDGWGLFNGLTMVTYDGYTGKLPLEKGDSCTFVEFDVFYKDLLVNEFTYESLKNLIERDVQLNKIL